MLTDDDDDEVGEKGKSEDGYRVEIAFFPPLKEGAEECGRWGGEEGGANEGDDERSPSTLSLFLSLCRRVV